MFEGVVERWTADEFLERFGGVEESRATLGRRRSS
jgi:hypothetical protein